MPAEGGERTFELRRRRATCGEAVSRSPRLVTGLATDGATFIASALRDGTLQELARYATDPERPNELMAWLESLLSDRPDILPEPRVVAQAFGRASRTFGQARMALDALWAVLRDVEADELTILFEFSPRQFAPLRGQPRRVSSLPDRGCLITDVPVSPGFAKFNTSAPKL
jgi:hypothetical protein